jgi:hypothetical protein
MTCLKRRKGSLDRPCRGLEKDDAQTNGIDAERLIAH